MVVLARRHSSLSRLAATIIRPAAGFVLY